VYVCVVPVDDTLSVSEYCDDHLVVHFSVCVNVMPVDDSLHVSLCVFIIWLFTSFILHASE